MAGATEGVILNPMVENAHVTLTEKLVGKTKWNFSEVLQFIREQMGIRTNGTLGPDSLTLKLKMEPHLFASVLYSRRETLSFPTRAHPQARERHS